MARIRHIALLTKDTEKLAGFYKAAFGLNEVARSGEPTENGRAIYLSDGHINLAILPARARAQAQPAETLRAEWEAFKARWGE